VNFFHRNISCSNDVSDVLILDINMLDFGVACIVLSKTNSTLAI